MCICSNYRQSFMPLAGAVGTDNRLHPLTQSGVDVARPPD